jgi:predicted enzyme related to lactoylglutathione lyase
MGERTQYTPGTFSWADLASPEPEAAKAYYGSLFGWELTDMPVDETSVYTMAAIAGRTVAAIAPQPPQQREAGVPPLWNSYITVSSADDAAERARELGAAVHAPAFDVLEAGRMAVIQDPQGAYFMVWEPRQHPGAGLVNAHGALSWNELATPDIEASVEFYSQLFGWSTEPMEGMETPYHVIRTADGHSNGGIRSAAASEPCYWLVYFGADDIDATLAQAQREGGTALMGPMDIGVGHLAAVQDPQGAVFALYAGRFDD